MSFSNRDNEKDESNEWLSYDLMSPYEFVYVEPGFDIDIITNDANTDDANKDSEINHLTPIQNIDKSINNNDLQGIGCNYTYQPYQNINQLNPQVGNLQLVYQLVYQPNLYTLTAQEFYQLNFPPSSQFNFQVQPQQPQPQQRQLRQPQPKQRQPRQPQPQQSQFQQQKDSQTNSIIRSKIQVQNLEHIKFGDRTHVNPVTGEKVEKRKHFTITNDAYKRNNTFIYKDSLTIAVTGTKRHKTSYKKVPAGVTLDAETIWEEKTSYSHRIDDNTVRKIMNLTRLYKKLKNPNTNLKEKFINKYKNNTSNTVLRDKVLVKDLKHIKHEDKNNRDPKTGEIMEKKENYTVTSYKYKQDNTFIYKDSLKIRTTNDNNKRRTQYEKVPAGVTLDTETKNKKTTGFKKTSYSHQIDDNTVRKVMNLTRLYKRIHHPSADVKEKFISKHNIKQTDGDDQADQTKENLNFKKRKRTSSPNTINSPHHKKQRISKKTG